MNLYATPAGAASPDARSSLRIIAGSAGQSGAAVLDDLFGQWVGGGRVLFLPIARPDNDPSIRGVQGRLRDHLAPYGVSELVTWLREDLNGADFVPDVSGFSGIYLGNGDPSVLRTMLFASGLVEPMIAAATAGCVMFGTSAGTMMLGADSAAAAGSYAMPRENLPPEAYRGLGLVSDPEGRPAIAIPHFSTAKEGMAQAIATKTGLPVCGVRDGNAYVLDRGEPGAIGDVAPLWFLPEAAAFRPVISLPRFVRAEGPERG